MESACDSVPDADDRLQQVSEHSRLLLELYNGCPQRTGQAARRPLSLATLPLLRSVRRNGRTLEQWRVQSSGTIRPALLVRMY